MDWKFGNCQIAVLEDWRLANAGDLAATKFSCVRVLRQKDRGLVIRPTPSCNSQLACAALTAEFNSGSKRMQIVIHNSTMPCDQIGRHDN